MVWNPAGRRAPGTGGGRAADAGGFRKEESEVFNIQWKLYNTVHNLMKIFRYGWTTAMVPSGLRAMAG